MTTIEQQLTETWQIHNKTCLLLIENITDEGLLATLSTRGGRTVGRQLAHMYNVRLMWAGGDQKKDPNAFRPFDKDAAPSREELKQAFIASGDIVEKQISKSIENNGKVARMKRGIVPLLGYLISHEAQHRGNILVTLKQCGHKINDTLKWGIWDWDKL